MNRFARGALTLSLLSIGFGLAGCGSMDTSNFDPTAIFDMEIFNTKKKLPGERKAVFPDGTPGVPQGVPQELVKGHQVPPEAEPAAQETQAAEAKPEPKPKPKPKPKVVERPRDDSTPTAVTVRPSSQAQASAQAPAQPQPQAQSPSQVQWPDPPPMQQKPTTAWPSSGQSSAVAWPDPPAPR
jgi:hypothetical protein